MGDNWGSIWQAWWEKKAFVEGLDPKNSFMVGYPWGTNVAMGGVKEWLWWGPLKILSIPFGEVMAFNIVTLISFPLAGFTMYLLVKKMFSHLEVQIPKFKVQKKIKYQKFSNLNLFWHLDFDIYTFPAFLAGCIFTFAPYHFWQSYTHISLAQIQWLPLYFLAMLYTFQKPSLKSGLLWGLSYAAVVYSCFHYAYFLGLVSIPLVGGWFFLRVIVSYKSLRGEGGISGIGKTLLTLILFGFVAIAAVLPVYLSVSKGQQVGAAGNVMQRDIQDLLSLSTRPWDFLIPAPDHFIFGKYTDSVYSWIRSKSMDFKTISAYLPERVLYLGWMPVLLLLVGLAAGLKGVWGVRGKRITAFFVILALLAFMLSLPPFIYLKTHKIYFPTYLLYKYLPMFRVYTRMGIIVQLAVSVLATFGVLSVFKKFPKIPVVTFVTFAILITLLEFQGTPFKHTTDLSKLEKLTPAYVWLAENTSTGAIIEYPQEYDTQEALFFQRIHKKPLFNMLGTPPQYKLWEKVHNITDPEVPGILKSLGVEYVVWHHTDTLYPKGNPLDEPRYRKFYEPPLRQDTAELNLVYKGADAYIFKITADATYDNKEEVWERYVE